ncbi:MAG: caspase family protein, partial [Pseudomonadota bacterium]
FGDVRSGRIVYAQKGTRFHGWTKNDSFAAFGNNDDRELTIVPMLIDNGDFLPKRRYGLGVSHFGLNVQATGSGDVNQFDFRELFELNLENNFLLVSSEEAFFLYGLDRAFERVLPNLTRPTPLREIEQRRLANVNEVNRLLRSRFRLTPFAFQVRYTYLALYNFNNHLVASGFDLHNDAPTIRRLQQGIKAEWRPGTFHLQTLAPVTSPIVATRTAGGTVTSRSVAAGDWRGFARVSSNPRPPKKIFQRLEEFGVPFALIQEGVGSKIRGTRDTKERLSKPIVNANGDVLTRVPEQIEETAALPSASDIRRQIYEVFPGTQGQIDVARNRDYAVREDRACSDPAHKVILGGLGSQFQRWTHADGETWVISARRCGDQYFTDKNPYYILDTRFRDEGIQPITRWAGGLLRLQQMKQPAFSLHDGRYLMVWGRDRGLVLIDLEDLSQSRGVLGKRVKDKYSDIRLAADLEHVVDVKPDGSFALLQLRSGNTVLSGRHVDDEIAVWTPNGFFDSTPEGSHLVKIRFAGAPGTYSFHQYERSLRRTGLVSRVMAGDALGSPDIGVAPAIDTSLELSGDTVLGKITRRSRAAIAEVLVFQDGILTDKLSVPDGPDFEFRTERKPGARWASVLAMSSDGLASLPSGRDLGPPSTPRKILSLAVGVDTYKDPLLPRLRFAVADAELLSGTFKSAAQDGAPQGQHVLLNDEDASPVKILRSVEEIVSKASPGDTVVISFAGHGVRDGDGMFYLATSGTSTQDLAGTALSFDALAGVLAGSKARVVVLLDACHSGMAGSKFLSTNDQAASGLLGNVPTGMIVFAASKGREFAEEHSELGHGLFSLAIADVVSKNRKASDLNGNGAIEVSEFYYGVKKRVIEQAKNDQTPWLARNQMIGEFSLF